MRLAVGTMRGMEFPLGLLGYFLMGICLRCAAAETVSIQRSNVSFEQSIPLSVVLPDQKAACRSLQIKWSPPTDAAGDSPFFFSIEPGMDPGSDRILKSSLSIAGLTAITACRLPWEGGSWTVNGTSLGEGASIEAALAAGLIATSCHVPVSRDTLILGSLYPDGCMGPVSQVKQRLEAAALAGIRRVVLSSLQLVEISSNGKYLDVGVFAESLGLDCTFVDHVVEAIELVLQRKVPIWESHFPLPRYGEKLKGYLETECQKELRALEPAQRNWPRDSRQLAALSLPQQELWKKIFQNYDLGVEAYRAGWLYAAQVQLREANAQLKAATTVRRFRREKWGYPAVENRVAALRQKMAACLEKTSMEHDDLQSGLVIAEERDWLYRVNALLEGARVLARQTLASRSYASESQRQQAQDFFWTAIEEAEYQLQDFEFYPMLDRWLNHEHLLPLRVQSRLGWDQLLLAHLAKAESLSRGFRFDETEREDLLFDLRLVAHTRLLRDLRLQESDLGENGGTRHGSSRAGGMTFVPGPAYALPSSSFSFLGPQSIGSIIRVWDWVNGYCETAFLNEKYLGPSRLAGTNPSDPLKRSRSILQRLLENAEISARRGMAAADEARISTAMLGLIYEKASFLQRSDREEDLLEALRHYWRCSLLGSLCWQLSFGIQKKPLQVRPHVEPLPAPIPAVLPAPPPISSEQEPLAPWMEPQDPGLGTVPDMLPFLEEEPPPMAVPAIPITPEEWGEFEEP